jgi:hypothetical protein
MMLGRNAGLPVALGHRPLAAHHDIDAVIAEDALKLADIGEARTLSRISVDPQQARDHQRQSGVLGAGSGLPVEFCPPVMRMVHAQSPVLTPPIPCETAAPCRGQSARARGCGVGLAALVMNLGHAAARFDRR